MDKNGLMVGGIELKRSCRWSGSRVGLARAETWWMWGRVPAYLQLEWLLWGGDKSDQVQGDLTTFLGWLRGRVGLARTFRM